MSSRITPTGVIRYQPEKSWAGLTVIPALIGMSYAKGAVLIDMNGNIVNTWEGLYGVFDNKMLPNGRILGCTRFSPGYWLDGMNLTQMDWDGRTEWSFDRGEELKNPQTGQTFWSARAHHDFQREGSPCGYFSPEQEPLTRGRTLINSATTKRIEDLCPHPIIDTRLIEIDREGRIVWSWELMDHWDEFGVEEIARAVFHRYFNKFEESDYVKDIYCNNVNHLGPNRWYEAGDDRFHPENIITDIRILNTSFIIDGKSGHIVWRMGPDFTYSKNLQAIGQIVGQHHVHMIPKGLPGEGNILLFDNGGQAGLGSPTPCGPTGYCNCTRGYSRVLEINPVTMEKVWAFNDLDLDYNGKIEARAFDNKLFSEYCSSADRLPNGNTLITETIPGRVIEVTPQKEIVWEYINPGGALFRAHRYPYEWFPQVETPKETWVSPPENRNIRITPEGGVEWVEAHPIYGDVMLPHIPTE